MIAAGVLDTSVFIANETGRALDESAMPDEVATALVRAAEGLSVMLLQSGTSPAAAMATWLGTSEPPAGFTVDRECELKSADEMKSVVRYARHGLDTDDVRRHIEAGKMPTRLAMTWNDRVSFVLTDSLQVRRLVFLDGVFDGVADQDRGFDADAAIVTGELRRLIPDLLEAPGGELDPMALPDPTAASGTPTPPVREAA